MADSVTAILQLSGDNYATVDGGKSNEVEERTEASSLCTSCESRKDV